MKTAKNLSFEEIQSRFDEILEEVIAEGQPIYIDIAETPVAMLIDIETAELLDDYRRSNE